MYAVVTLLQTPKTPRKLCTHCSLQWATLTCAASLLLAPMSCSFTPCTFGQATLGTSKLRCISLRHSLLKCECNVLQHICCCGLLVWELPRGTCWRRSQHTSHWQGMLAIKAHACLACEMCAACTANLPPSPARTPADHSNISMYQHIKPITWNAAS